VESRGGVTGGATVLDFLAHFEKEGYRSSFLVRAGGNMECTSCGAVLRADEFPLHRLRRVEGASDPADMCIVGATTCRNCGARGTFTACIGASCPPEDADVLRLLDHSTRVSRIPGPGGDLAEDPSLVRDTGWLPGPRRG
jgi:hypothetical protein